MMMTHLVRKKLLSSAISSSSSLLTRISPVNTKFTLSASKKLVHSRSFTSSRNDSTNSGLVRWWAGVSEEEKHPYGQLIHTSAEQGRYLARSYSPWQLASAKNGTPLFEKYVTTGLQGEYREQAIYIKQKEACHHSLGSLERTQLELGVFPLTALGSKADDDQWIEKMIKFMAATGNYMDEEAAKNFVAKHRSNQHVVRDLGTEFVVDSLQEKTVVHFVFTVGDIVDKVTRILNKNVLRVPGTLERKECFSFCLKFEGDKDRHVSDDHNHEVYRTTDHSSLDFVDYVVRGIPTKGVMGEEDHRKFISLLVNRAENQQPLLSHLTTFNRINIPDSSDPLNGLCIGSNGYLATEVIQLRRLFGSWHELDGIKEVSEPELCEYVEAVNLTGDFDMPASQGGSPDQGSTPDEPGGNPGQGGGSGSLTLVKDITWEVCALANSIGGPSGGFYCFLAISAAAVNMAMKEVGRYGSCLSPVWRPDATHAMTLTDSNLGSAGTLDMLAFILERKQIPGYFKHANTRVYYLYGGSYNKLHIPWCLTLDQVKFRPSTPASEAFIKSLKYQQPLEMLIASKRKVHVLRWYFSPTGMIGFHGMWVGEIQNSRIICVNNDITKSPYAPWYSFVKETVEKLPAELLEEMQRTWTAKHPNQTTIDFATTQLLKHAVQGKDILIDDYWQKATELARVFSHEKLMQIRERMNYQWGKFYKSEELRQEISKDIGKEVQLTCVPDAEHGVLVRSMTAVLDSECSPIDHIDPRCRHEKFRFVMKNSDFED